LVDSSQSQQLVTSLRQNLCNIDSIYLVGAKGISPLQVYRTKSRTAILET